MKIEVNGAYMDKDFFEENLNEARGYLWKKTDTSKIIDHQHCIICTIAISNKDPNPVWRSGNVWLCEFCHNKFMK